MTESNKPEIDLSGLQIGRNLIGEDIAKESPEELARKFEKENTGRHEDPNKRSREDAGNKEGIKDVGSIEKIVKTQPKDPERGKWTGRRGWSNRHQTKERDQQEKPIDPTNQAPVREVSNKEEKQGPSTEPIDIRELYAEKRNIEDRIAKGFGGIGPEILATKSGIKVRPKSNLRGVLQKAEREGLIQREKTRQAKTAAENRKAKKKTEENQQKGAAGGPVSEKRNISGKGNEVELDETTRNLLALNKEITRLEGSLQETKIPEEQEKIRQEITKAQNERTRLRAEREARRNKETLTSGSESADLKKIAGQEPPPDSNTKKEKTGKKTLSMKAKLAREEKFNDRESMRNADSDIGEEMRLAKLVQKSDPSRSEDKEKSAAYAFTSKDSENILSTPEEAEELREAIKNAHSFEDLVGIFESLDAAKGSPRWFSKMDLIGRLYLVQAGKITLDYIKTAGGLREKVAELLKELGPIVYKPAAPEKEAEEQEKSTEPPKEDEKPKLIPDENRETGTLEGNGSADKKTNQPKGVEQEKERPIDPSPAPETKDAPEIIEAEKTFREKIQAIFGEKMESALSKLNSARASYGIQLITKIKHEHTQSKIERLKRSLKTMFTRKPAENLDSYQKAEESYYGALREFKDCMNDKQVLETVLELNSFGDIGLEIIKEERVGFYQPLIQQLLVMERKAIQDIERIALPEKDRNFVDELTELYRRAKWKKTGAVPFIETFTANTSNRYDY